MRPALHVTTRVLPGKKIEITAPELTEGEAVEVTISPAREPAPKPGLLDFLESLRPGPRSAESWEELERELQRERDAWEQ